MDNLVCSVHQRKPNKFKTKSKRKPRPIHSSTLKVVYISNPIRVKVTASGFRALVQELTGQDSELPDPAKFSFEGALLAPDVDPPGAVPVDDSAREGLGLGGASAEHHDDDDEPVQEVSALSRELYDRLPDDEAAPFEVFDDDSDELFVPQMLENLTQLCHSTLL